MLSTGGTDTYAYLGATETVAEISNSTTGTIRSMLDAGGSRLATRAGSAAATFTLFDHLGSLVGLMNSTGTITEATRFDGYGESVDRYGATVSPWRFRGQLDVSPTASAPLYQARPRTR